MEANNDANNHADLNDDKFDAETWDDALTMHRTSLIGLVNQRLAYIPPQVYDIYDWMWRMKRRWLGHDENDYPGPHDQDNLQSDQGSQSTQDDNLEPSRKRPLGDFDYGYRINFTNMQRIYLRQLQAKMIKVGISLRFDTEEEKIKRSALLLETTLSKYGNYFQYHPYRWYPDTRSILRWYARIIWLTWRKVHAVRDHEYMTKFYEQKDDPFVASSERQHDQFLLLKGMQDASKWPGCDDLRDFQDVALRTGPWERSRQGEGAQPIGGTRRVKLQKTLWSRIGGAAIGGMFLVGPMWALVLKREVVFQLSLTTGLVTAFGLLMAWSLSTLEAVFTATLAYAAILMVFVGVMMQELD